MTSPGTGSPNRLLYSPLTTAGRTAAAGGLHAADRYTGSLSGTGDYDIHAQRHLLPVDCAGTHKGCLTGPSGADFDLSLYKWNGSSWSIVARGETASSSETITYSGTAGYYYWEVYSYSGSGSYTFSSARP